MSVRKAGKRSAGEVPKKASGLYLYCVGEAAALSKLLEGKLPAPVEEDGRLELIEQESLAAVTSLVPLKDYDEAALAAHLADAAWMALRAMRHERVVDYFAKRASIVPLRFGVIYLDSAGVERMLAERGDEIRAAIERLEGREEWGVNIYCDRKALMEAISSISPRLKELNEQASSASPGQGYLMRKKMDSMRNEEARAEVRRAVERIEQALQKESEGSSRLRLLKDEAGEHGELVGKLAFLVERERFEEFRTMAERLAGDNADAGFRLELTGPWPAYNFVVQG
ncbi:MAG TPA: GvpL/GvpF family gas vesicle protein [Pyrinomonadaceae bacterium]|nr:GvpL/GvpF family gas vesicle protein [Pyrinomonadaceae bacterium]